MNEENTFKVNTYTEYRAFTELKYFNLFGCNAHPKSDNEIAFVDATVYERVKRILRLSFSNAHPHQILIWCLITLKENSRHLTTFG